MSRPANWTREEHILAFDLYSRIPFGSIHERNPDIQDLAQLLGRSVGSVSYKLANFARLDPALQARGIKGMSHGAKGEESVWAEFATQPEALTLESQRLLADRLGQSIETVADIDTADLPAAGVEREAIVKLRVNQSFFRRRILSAYSFRCCVSGLTTRSLLTASHIRTWAKDPNNRLNPRNGLCLNALHDRAFDRHLLWIETDFIIRFAPALHLAAPQDPALSWLTSFEGKQLQLPARFAPDPAFLAEHAAISRDQQSVD